MKIIASLFSFPALLAFLGVWIVASIAKPLCVVSLVCVLANPAAARRKLQLFVWTLQYLVLCNDKKWTVDKRERENVESYFAVGEDGDHDKKIERKTIIFVRHAVSTWNETFNPGDRPKSSFILYFLPNLLYAIAVEWYFWILGVSDESWFFDSPLSERGLEQARGLQAFLRTNIEYSTPKEADMIRRLRGEAVSTTSSISASPPPLLETSEGSTRSRSSKSKQNNATSTTPNSTNKEQQKQEASSQLVSSNLRRAVSTIIIGFQDRLDQTRPSDKVLILSCLQEISRNPDALSLTPPESKIILPSWTDPKSPLRLHHYRNGSDLIDTSKNTGNKPVTSNGYRRIQEFCKIAFEDISKETIIVCGHSLWFKEFFKAFLPLDCDHISKRKKLLNGGVVGFTLERTKITTATTGGGEDEPRWVHRIDPKSIVVLYGGF